MLIIIHKKTIPWKVTVKKILATVCHYIQKHFGPKNENIQELIFCVVKNVTSFIFWWTSSLNSGSSGALIDKLENVSKYLLTSQFLTETNPLQ